MASLPPTEKCLPSALQEIASLVNPSPVRSVPSLVATFSSCSAPCVTLFSVSTLPLDTRPATGPCLDPGVDLPPELRARHTQDSGLPGAQLTGISNLWCHS